MKSITFYGKLGIGKTIKVDDADFEWLNKYKWYLSGRKDKLYAITHLENKKRISMHRLILKMTDSKILVDHEDGDGLNNQRGNIRIANKSQNAANRQKATSATSKYLGVHIHYAYGGKYKYIYASCMKDGKNYNIKCSSEIEAALKYNELAIMHHGEFARLNIIE